MNFLRKTLFGGMLVLACMLAWGGDVTAPSRALAAGTKRLVDDDKVECPTATYTTVSAAIADASPGDTITVCSGTYIGQVVIDTKPGLKLIGKGIPIVRPGVSASGAVIRVSNSFNVTVQGLYVDGADSFSPASTSMAGIVFENSSGTITRNVITRIRHSPSDGASQGYAIDVHGSAAPTGQVVKIMTNTLHDYQRRGISVAGNFKPSIVKNLIQTSGPSSVSIYLSGVGGGSVTKNVLQGNNNTGQGLAMHDTSNMKVSGNSINGIVTAIYMGGSPTPATNNRVIGNRIHDCVTGVSINGDYGINGSSNLVKGNRIISTSYYFVVYSGIKVAGSGATGNKIIGNTIQGYPNPGYIDGGTGTVISGNKWSLAAQPGL